MFHQSISRQLCSPWQFIVIGWSVSSRHNTPCRPCLCSHDGYGATSGWHSTPSSVGLYQTLVLSVLLYAADTWTLLSADVRTLDAFHQKCLMRQLLGIRWYDRVQNDEVLQRTGLTSLSRLLSRRRISLFGHVARLDDDTRQTWLFSSTSTYHSTDLLTARNVAHLVVHWISGLTSYETIPPVWLETSGCCRPWTWWCNDATALAGCKRRRWWW